MRKLSDEELLAEAQRCYENRSRQQRALEVDAIDYCAKQNSQKSHPYRKARKVRTSSELYREESWTLFSYRES